MQTPEKVIATDLKISKM